MDVRLVQMQATFEFADLSADALAIERSREFKIFIKQRYCNLFGSFGTVPIAANECQGFNFEESAGLKKCVDQALLARTDGIRTDGEAIGPMCWPDPGEPEGWWRTRRFLLSDAKSAPLTVGPMNNVPPMSEAVRRELEDMRLSITVSWQQSYAT